ncbi:protein FAM227B isoform X12 [Equus przewalskii]|uniref:Protein FAM227B isoform X12 n=1 Tax=Equus przewalskii TaxID=9798 RepID=A0ABM4L9B0_EQUPR
MAGQLFYRWMRRTHRRKMEEPPKNIEEFLKIQNWDYWPREIPFEDDDKWLYTLKKIEEDTSFSSIYTHLWGKVPRIYDPLLIMESRLEECLILLENHASKIFEWNRVLSKTSSHEKLERYKAFLRKYQKKKKIMLSAEMETKKNIEEKVFKIWKTYFLSEASIALLHDCFWWWFLHKFKVYPDCLAQAIYAAFQEAFPESSNLFNDEFKQDLGNNIFLWLSGLKPHKGFWTHWKLNKLATTTIHGTKKIPSDAVKDCIARSQERITASIDFNMAEILKNPRAYTLLTSKEEPRLSSLTTKSHYSSSGPEFNRVLFNFGGQSPLILYYLKMHELNGISKIPRQTKIKFTEILREPPPAPTYRDIIKEAKRQFAKNQKDLRMEKHRISEEIKLLRQRQERIDKELDRLQTKATKKPHEAKDDFEKFLHKVRPEAQIEREFLASLSSSSTTTENCNLEEEESQEKPEINFI